ncbi:unnamed protein product [Ceutorhynchus assimilis]|uniref:Host cell factor Kelch-repeats domain-containing protein n=1 Tax=Ceutorhynchus assimilis TaxID=467358 RepID=A0A9N9QMI6_9CUCU|nr:unnamed protein product [Ceutorhynchus assimilis]
MRWKKTAPWTILICATCFASAQDANQYKDPYNRSLHTSTLINNKMFVFGGWVAVDANNRKLVAYEKEWKCTNTIGCLNLETMNWDYVDTSSGDESTVPCPRAGHCAVGVGTRIYVWSGRDGYQKAFQVCLKHLWYLDVDKPPAPSKLSLIKAETKIPVTPVVTAEKVNLCEKVTASQQAVATKPVVTVQPGLDTTIASPVSSNTIQNSTAKVVQQNSINVEQISGTQASDTATETQKRALTQIQPANIRTHNSVVGQEPTIIKTTPQVQQVFVQKGTNHKPGTFQPQHVTIVKTSSGLTLAPLLKSGTTEPVSTNGGQQVPVVSSTGNPINMRTFTNAETVNRSLVTTDALNPYPVASPAIHTCQRAQFDKSIAETPKTLFLSKNTKQVKIGGKQLTVQMISPGPNKTLPVVPFQSGIEKILRLPETPMILRPEPPTTQTSSSVGDAGQNKTTKRPGSADQTGLIKKNKKEDER